MASISRRKAIFGAAGLAVGVGAVRIWYLHQTLPPRDPAAEDHSRQAQDRLLSENGGSIHSRFVQLANPNIRAQALEGGQGEPVLLIHGGNGIAAVGLHSIPGILLFDIICCTKIPEFSKACALKNRIGIDAAT